MPCRQVGLQLSYSYSSHDESERQDVIQLQYKAFEMKIRVSVMATAEVSKSNEVLKISTRDALCAICLEAETHMIAQTHTKDPL